MARFWQILSAAFILVSLGVYVLFSYVAASGPGRWVDLYFTQARVPMFTGFLTLGSFLLTLQTAIIQRLREAYDHKSSEESFLALYAQETNPTKKENLRYYESLQNISTALSASVILALMTASCQMTLGFLGSALAVSVCIGAAVTALGLVVYLTIELLAAHKAWFAKMETDKRKALGLEK